MAGSFHKQVISIIKRIPRGRVATYGQIAGLAGNNRAARQVVRTLHTSSEKEHLPWYRVVNSRGRISLARGAGYELQHTILEKEGVSFSAEDVIDLDRFGWKPQHPAD
jgi:methylated-DNA-protein-cysteine methyltransferase-like protein